MISIPVQFMLIKTRLEQFTVNCPYPVEYTLKANCCLTFPEGVVFLGYFVKDANTSYIFFKM